MTKTRNESESVRFPVGEHVVLVFGDHRASAVVIEDRGPIGVGGRRLYRVELANGDPDEPAVMELPADQIERR